MTISEFSASLQRDTPPKGLPPLLTCLWHDARDDWHTAHDIADGMPGADAAWVHAYLHRKEGDIWNANYWYRRAGRTMPDASLEEEWQMLVEKLL